MWFGSLICHKIVNPLKFIYFLLSENPAVIESAVREALLKLLKARYIERCPAPEPVVSTLIKEETTTRKRGAKSAKVIVGSCQFLWAVGLFFY